MHNPKLSKKFFIPLLFLICFLTFLVVRTLTWKRNAIEDPERPAYVL